MVKTVECDDADLLRVDAERSGFTQRKLVEGNVSRLVGAICRCKRIAICELSPGHRATLNDGKIEECTDRKVEDGEDGRDPAASLGPDEVALIGIDVVARIERIETRLR